LYRDILSDNKGKQIWFEKTRLYNSNSIFPRECKTFSIILPRCWFST
jgi:hypothetical protein